MKTFKDLKFEPHPIGNGKQARMFFKNGYGISVVRFNRSYTSSDADWEIAVLFGNAEKSSLTYNTPITNDVIGWLSDDGVTKVMEQIQALK